MVVVNDDSSSDYYGLEDQLVELGDSILGLFLE